MGTVNFNTTVEKTVTINKTVNLTVDKNVASTVNLTGSLATAEASADAVGATGGGGGGSFFFLIDDGSDLQITNAAPIGINPNSGTAPGPNFPVNPGDFDNPNFPDGEFFLGTDIPDVAQRTFVVDVLSAGGNASLRAGDAGDRLAFDNGDETVSNQSITWQADIDGDGVFGEADDAFAVLADFCDPNDPETQLVFTDILVDAGLPNGIATTRLEFEFEDADGDIAVGRIAVTDDFTPNSNLAFSLRQFLTGAFTPAPGTEVAPGVIQLVDTPNADLDFDSIVRMELSIIGNPDVGSALPTTAFESPATGAVDVSLDDIFIICEGEDEFGFLAETDTFAQVEAGGAFSFSEALAALSPLPDVLIG